MAHPPNTPDGYRAVQAFRFISAKYIPASAVMRWWEDDYDVAAVQHEENAYLCVKERNK